jgi:hypothetical protein
MWSAVKGKDIANYAATDLADLWRAARRGLTRIRRNPALLWSFLAAAGLAIPPTCPQVVRIARSIRRSATPSSACPASGAGLRREPR